MLDIRVQRDIFDPSLALNEFQAQLSPQVGAVVHFTGLVRADGPSKTDAQPLTALRLEHYPGMTEREIARLANEAKARWPLERLLIIHRYGVIEVGAPIMMVATAAPHRRAAFEAADFLMDHLKTSVPFWKYEEGLEGWVAAKASDDKACARW